MSHWPKDKLQMIAETDDLHVSPFREDGITYGTPTWIWSVVVDDDLYVRPYNGKDSRWYQAALRQEAGRDCCRRDDLGSHIRAGGWPRQRARGRCLPGEIPGQPVSRSDGGKTRFLGDHKGLAPADSWGLKGGEAPKLRAPSSLARS